MEMIGLGCEKFRDKSKRDERKTNLHLT